MAKKASGKNRFLHLIRYGTSSDQKYLLGEFLKTYDMAVLNANMVIHAPAALSTFIFEHSLSKPFIIDPQTFAFELDLKHIKSKSKGKSQGLIKKPFVKLAEQYGDVFTSRLKTGSPITPKNIRKNMEQIVASVCNFQINFLIEQTKEEDVEKYYDFVEDEGDLNLNRTPEYIIPPYFYLGGGSFNEWLSVNIELVSETVDQYPNEKIAPQVVVSKEALHDSEKFDAIINAYSNLEGIDTILIWVDDHKETSLTSSEIDLFFSFIKALSENHPVINLYGGGLSVIAGRTNILPNYIGVCHSIEYGESRAVAPVGGGIPVSKFYLPSTYNRFLYRDVITVLKNNDWLKNSNTYFKNVCSCKTCRTVIRDEPDSEFGAFGAMSVKKKKTPDGQEISKQYPTADAKDLCKRHYMHCKHLEYTDKKFQDLKEVIFDMKAASKHISKRFPEETNHLKTWLRSLENEVEE